MKFLSILCSICFASFVACYETIEKLLFVENDNEQVK
jgi:hypothetical protein